MERDLFVTGGHDPYEYLDLASGHRLRRTAVQSLARGLENGARTMDSDFIGLEPLEPRMLLSAGPFTFLDADGDSYKVRLSGPGEVTVVQNDPDGDGRGGITSLQLTGTTSRSSLKVTVKKSGGGDGIVQIGSITGGDLRMIHATKADLSGDGINLTGALGTLKMRDLTAGADLIATSVRKMQVRQVGAGSQITLNGGLQRLQVKGDKSGVAGDFRGAIDAANIGKVTIKGSLIGADIRADNVIESIVAGTAVDSIVFVGIVDDKTTLPDHPNEFVNKSGRIGTFKLKGGSEFWIDNTHVAAWNIGRYQVGFANPNNDDAGDYGAAMGKLGYYSYRDASGLKKTKNPRPEGVGKPFKKSEPPVHVGDFSLRFFDVG